MPNGPTRPPRAGHPASPCNDVCTLNDDQVCIGCGRTMDEIVAWSAMTAEQQWALVQSLPARPGRDTIFT